MNLPEPVQRVVIREGLPTLVGERDVKSTDERLYSEAQVKELLAQADKDFSDGMTVVHLQVADQMRRKYEPVLKMAFDELERAEAIMLSECGIGVINRVTVAAIRKVLA